MVPVPLPPGTGTARGTRAAGSSKYTRWGSSLCSMAPKQELTTALSADQAHLLIAESIKMAQKASQEVSAG